MLGIAVAAWQPIFDSAREIVGDELFEPVSPDAKSRKRNSVAKECQAEDPIEVWVAEIDSEIARFITVKMNYDEGVAEIGNNAIATKFHGRGLGTQMYRFVL
ncbi:MAG: hypothetical protein CL784_07050 [Chloroflexi bacterium]|nr:hypothetical protein [Chloroflexota bacterium]